MTGTPDLLITVEALSGPVPEPLGVHVARVCAAVRAQEWDGAVDAAADVPRTQRADAAQALVCVAPLFGAAPILAQLPWGLEQRPTRTPMLLARAELATNPAELAAILSDLWGPWPPVGLDQVRGIILRRPTSWRATLGRQLGQLRGVTAWRAARILATDGLVPSPVDVPASMVLRIPMSELPSLRQADPMVQSMLDRLWTTPGAGRVVANLVAPPVAEREVPAALAAAYRASCDALLEAWGADDPVRRPGTIDGCLDAMAGAAGPSPADLRGWVLVHDRLAVTEDEVSGRQGRYLALATEAPGPAARVARRELGRLIAAGRLDPEQLLDCVPSALLRSEKGAVRDFLGLLDTAVGSGLLDMTSCAEAVQPLVHQLPRGVDSAATQLLRSWDATVSARPVAPWAPLAPSDLPSPPAVQPLTSTDELVELLLQVLRGSGAGPVAVEQVVDGMMRLREPGASGAAELVRATRAGDGSVVRGLQRLVLAWLGHRLDPVPFGSVTVTVRCYDESQVPGGVGASRERLPQGSVAGRQLFLDSWVRQEHTTTWMPPHLVGARLQELEPLVVGPPGRSLALPDTVDGVIDGQALLARLRERRAARRAPGRRELAAALQRVAPAALDTLVESAALPEASAAWPGLLQRPPELTWRPATPWIDQGQRRTLGPLMLWQPAQASATGHDDDPVSWWLDTRHVAEAWNVFRTSHSLHAGDLDFRSWLLQLPWHPDVAAAHLQSAVITRDAMPDVEIAELLAMLAISPTPLGPQAAGLLCWGATYLNARTRAAAAETIAGAARHGTLTGPELGRAVLRLVGPGAGPFLESHFHLEPEPPKLSRIAGTLADAALLGDHGEAVVLDAVVTCLSSLTEMRGGAALLAVAATIAERRG
ncbi:MAG: hypothetical protein B7X41_10920, partial [Microbacterium sp. 14-71-5]